ncbi:MAG TPA: hypothetical protein VKC35_09970, partial [Vicinamibacterales bacterium]|nr:hypothetical protein [Vicinamibacterales bacterium]
AVVMQRPIAALPGAVLLIVLVGAAAHAAGTLDMYFIDTEGGQATLLVTHFHGDHAGGIAHLALPVGTFVDHGPALQDVSLTGGAGANPADCFAANLDDTDNTRHPVYYLKVSASDDGSFAVFNSRTNETKRYPARR